MLPWRLLLLPRLWLPRRLLVMGLVLLLVLRFVPAPALGEVVAVQVVKSAELPVPLPFLSRVPAPSRAAVSSCPILDTSVPPARAGGNEGVPRPILGLLLPCDLHLPISARDHLLYHLHGQVRSGEKDTFLNAETGGKVSHQVLVSVYVAKIRTMGSESTAKHREPAKIRLRGLIYIHAKSVILLRKFRFFCGCLRLVVFTKKISQPSLGLAAVKI